MPIASGSHPLLAVLRSGASSRGGARGRLGFWFFLLVAGLSRGALAGAALPAAGGTERSAGAAAREILSASGVRGGLILHLGCGDGTITAELGATEGVLVQGVEADEAAVARARQTIRALGRYGRVSVIRLEGERLPYADDLADLVVVDRPGAVGSGEVHRVLAPGGVALTRGEGAWKPWRKPRPADIDDWTHFLHAADNNAVARDRRVGPPRSLQWKSGPLWCRSHDGVPSSVALVLCASGRLFAAIDEGLPGRPDYPQRWRLVARGAFNGVRLWKRPLARRPGQKSIVATGAEVLVAGGEKGLLAALGAARGEVARTFAGTEGGDELVVSGGTAFLHRRGGRASGGARAKESVLAVELETGRVLWNRPAPRMLRGSLAAAGDRVFFHLAEEVVSLDARSGEDRWRARCAGSLRGSTLVVYGGAVLVAAPGGLRAFSADDGASLWRGPRVHDRLGLFGAHGLVWLTEIQEHGRTFLWTPAPVVARGFDPRTGAVERTITVERLATPGHHIRCYPAKATERFLLLPKRGVEFVDLEGDHHQRNDWLRAPCRHGMLPASGLLYAPPHQCFCYPGVRLTAFNALTSRGGGRLEREEFRGGEVTRLWRGPAAGEAASIARAASEERAGDWPQYRHDARRSGRASCELPAKLEVLWRRELGGDLSSPVVAGGRLLVAEKGAHSIRCLDAGGGAPLWRFTAEGPIDSPPTVHRGRVLFGSSDGRVYALRASDGALLWRFRAAPAEHRIVAFERLESAWPVHGSVLVQRDVAYVVAGRSSFLDGGIFLFALDPATGRVLHRRRLESRRPDPRRDAGRPFDMEGARSDLLVSDGEDLYLFFRRFGPDLREKPAPRITKLGDREVGLHLMSNAGFLDTEWFDRSYWTYSRRWPGFYFGYEAPKTGQILVFDDETTYGLHVFTTRKGHSPRVALEEGGYELFADSNDNRPVLRPTAAGREKGQGFSRMLPPKWSKRVAVRARAMLLAAGRLYLAGSPEEKPPEDPYAALEGRRGGLLWTVSAADGKRLAERRIEHPPVFDGLIAARGRLYLADTAGRVTCFGEKEGARTASAARAGAEGGVR